VVVEAEVEGAAEVLLAVEFWSAGAAALAEVAL